MFSKKIVYVGVDVDMQHVLPSRFVRVRYYGLMHSSKAQTIASIKTRLGCVQMSERYASKPNKQCENCKKPFRVTTIIFPIYAFRFNNLQKKPRGNFYNTTIMSCNNRACNTALHLTVETS